MNTFSIIILILFAKNSIADNSTVIKVPREPIVINTVAHHYENPTLDQYTLCTHSRDKCLNACDGDYSCREKCQICPILTDQDILVQGINDTALYRSPITMSKVNQTNIIRLTNEIRNIIRTNLGNITAHNQNNITIYHKTSKTGGKFGLGSTEKGPCCHLLEPQRCRSSANGPICTHRRQQTCGSHCISRVMRAKRVVTCSEMEPENCTQSIEYIPQPRRLGCQYTSKWPFISCKTGSQMQHSVSRRKTNCARCYEIPFLSIIRGQVPRACHPCFGKASVRRPSALYPYIYNTGYGQYPDMTSFSPHQSYQPYQLYQPYQPYQPVPFMMPQPTPTYNDQYNIGSILGEDSNEMPVLDGDFKIEEQKCLNEDGTAMENCINDENPLRLHAETNLNSENADEGSSDWNDGFDYELNEEEVPSNVQRRRRQE